MRYIISFVAANDDTIAMNTVHIRSVKTSATMLQTVLRAKLSNHFLDMTGERGVQVSIELERLGCHDPI